MAVAAADPLKGGGAYSGNIYPAFFPVEINEVRRDLPPQIERGTVPNAAAS